MYTLTKKIEEGVQTFILDGCDDMDNFRLHIRRNLYNNDMFFCCDRFSTTTCLVIDQENYPIYQAFRNIMEDMMSGEIFKEGVIDVGVSIESLNKNNKPALDRLYDPRTKSITWLTDDEVEERAARFKMSFDNEENINIEFSDYFPISEQINVYLSSEGSRYGDCFLAFVRLFDDLAQYKNDDLQIDSNEKTNRLIKDLPK